MLTSKPRPRAVASQRDGAAIPAPAGPQFPEIGVIALVPNPWGGPWMPREHVLTRLARYFNVVWVDPAAGWRESWLPGSARRRPINPNHDAGPGFVVYHPPRWLPQMYRPRALAGWLTHTRLRQARQRLDHLGVQRTILYLWRPELGFGLDLVRHDLSCFHIDDEYTFSEVELPLSEEERQLITRVDQVIIHSPALLEKKGHLNPHTALVPNGVDYAAYATPAAEPDDLRAIPHPRIGYVGVIKTQLDLPLVTRLAVRHPEWSFVFVGPVHVQGEAIDALTRQPNVHFLGAKQISELPAYTQHLDVCAMYYAVNDYTKFIYPLKLHEYLATGRPVVGTPIRSLQDFRHVVTLARSSDEWSTALQRALGPDASTPAVVAERRRVAQEHDWDRLVGIIARTLCERLGPLELERFDAMSRAAV